MKELIFIKTEDQAGCKYLINNIFLKNFRKSSNLYNRVIFDSHAKLLWLRCISDDPEPITDQIYGISRYVNPAKIKNELKNHLIFMKKMKPLAPSFTDVYCNIDRKIGNLLRKAQENSSFTLQ